MPAASDASIVFFDAGVLEAGAAGATIDVRRWPQLVLYPKVKAWDVGAGPLDWIEWYVQRAYDNGVGADWHEVHVIGQKFITTPGTDEDPVGFRVRYLQGAGDGVKPSILVPTGASFMRVWVVSSADAEDSTFQIRGELARYGPGEDVGGG